MNLGFAMSSNPSSSSSRETDDRVELALELLTSASCRRHERYPRQGQRRGRSGGSTGDMGSRALEFPEAARSSPLPCTASTSSSRSWLDHDGGVVSSTLNEEVVPLTETSHHRLRDCAGPAQFVAPRPARRRGVSSDRNQPRERNVLPQMGVRGFPGPFGPSSTSPKRGEGS
jgi:hypothetical protein